MKEIIIQKLKSQILNLIDKEASDFIAKNLSGDPSLEEYQTLLSKVQSGEIEIK